MDRDDKDRAAASLDLYAGLERPDGAKTPGTVSPPAPSRSVPPHWTGQLTSNFPRAIRDRYEVRGVLGEGGMGIVLEAHDVRMGRSVAIKGVRDPRSLDAARRERLLGEARIHARLTHPNILPVYDSWTDVHGNPWCSMLRVSGVPGRPDAAVSLAGRLAALRHLGEIEARPMGELLQTFLQVCRGVTHAHRTGIVHRDLKPDNVLLGPSGEALIADWGLAADVDLVRDETNEMVGTPGYAAPEQLGELGPPRSDERSDVYSLGILLEELVTGVGPSPAPASGGPSTTSQVSPGRWLPERVPQGAPPLVLRTGRSRDRGGRDRLHHAP
ncbi:MAG: serine/threonine protein kinase [Candidatus Riflebacteria bacterium]|nr:serine/threonine protein kinase [Candidatus Riflebacteria bacterium]